MAASPTASEEVAPSGERAAARDDDDGRQATVARWIIAFLIGLATVTATGLAWRGAQIGSTAAFEDRQSISETILAEQAIVTRTVAIASQAREYARYRADYAVAAALDAEADRLAARGDDALAGVSRGEAEALRTGATRRAAAAGVFPTVTLADDALRADDTPRPFDVEQRLRALAAEQATSLSSPNDLDPQGWADHAEAIRDRIAGLSRWAFVVLVSVVLYTLAELAGGLRATAGFAAGGLVVYLVGLVGALTTDFF